MSFICWSPAEFGKWKKEAPCCKEMNTNLWDMNLNDAVRDGTEEEYLQKCMTDEPLILTGAEHLWGKKASRHFFNRLHDAREKLGLQTALVTDLSEMQAAIFRYHMNISCALYKLSDHHFEIPECPVIFEGDSYATVHQLYEWKNNFGVDMNIEVGRILSEIHPRELPDHCAYTYQRDLGDYYLSIGRSSMALSVYLHGYYGISPGNYSYLKRWDYLLAMAEAYAIERKGTCASEICGGIPTALSILDKLIADTENWKELKGADAFHKRALLKKIMILGRTDSKEEGERLLCENLPWIKKIKGDLAFIFELMDAVDIYRGTDVSADILLHIAGQSDELQTLRLFDENRGAWVLGQGARGGAYGEYDAYGEYGADTLRDKLSHTDRILDRFREEICFDEGG